MLENTKTFKDNAINNDSLNDHELSMRIPVTESQLEIWLSCKLGGDDANRAFNQSVSVKFKGNFNKKAFDSSLIDIIQRHESLRSVFSEDGAQMLIYKKGSIDYLFEDISSLNEDEIENKIRDYKQELAYFAFDLLNGPLIRFCLFKLNELEYYFTLTAHHIICDGYSTALIVKDLGDLYTNYLLAEKSILSKPDLFSDYAINQAKFIQSDEYLKIERFWLEQFKNDIPQLRLPTDFPRPIPRSFKSSRLDFKLEKKLLNELKRIGNKEGCSTATTILAVFEIFLFKETAQTEIIVGIPTAFQVAGNKLNLLGHCVNFIPLKSRQDTELNFSDYLRIRNTEVQQALKNKQLTFGSMLKKLKIQRDAAHIPLAPVAFNLSKEFLTSFNFHNLKIEYFNNPRAFENFELFLNVWEANEVLNFEWSYNTQLFNEKTIESMMNSLDKILNKIVLDPNQKIKKLLSLDELEGEVQGSINNRVIESNKDFWLKKFKGELNALELPLDEVRTAAEFNNYGCCNLLINSELLAGFSSMLKSNETSLRVGLIALVTTFLHRYTNQEDIIIGKQQISNIDGIPNILVLRNQFKGSNSYIELLKIVNAEYSENLKHQPYSFDSLLKDLNFSLTKGRHPLIDVLVDVHNNVNTNTAGLDLIFKFHYREDGFRMEINFNSAIFKMESVKRMGNHLIGLMSAIVKSPMEAIDKLDFLSELEKKWFLSDVNDTKVNFQSNKTLLDLFNIQVQKTPDHLAVSDDINSLTYKQLDIKSDLLASNLINKLKLSDEYIAIHLDRSVETIVAMLAVFKVGKAYLPMEPYLPNDRKLVILNSVACSVIITDQINLDLTNSIGLSILSIVNVNNVLKYDKSETDDKNYSLSSEDIAYIIFTSGSTGVPKGVMVRHRAVINLIEWVSRTFEINENDKLLCSASISFDLSVYDIFGMLSKGGCLRIATNSELKDPRVLTEILYNEKITFWDSAPAAMQQLIPFFQENNHSRNTSLRLAFLSGDWVPLTLPGELKSAFPKVNVVALGGATEATVWSNYFIVEEVNPKWRSIPYGKPIQNAQYYILNSVLQLVPVGVTGDLYIGGEVLASGYNDQELTAKKFVQNPFVANERIYNTGDKARYYPDGNIEFLGRIDDQVKVRGYRIELGEIENILQQYPQIDRTVVLIKDESDGNKTIVAYVVSQVQLKSEDLRNYLLLKLPAYMVPSYFIVLTELPLTSNGKLDRKKLPSPLYKNEDEFHKSIFINDLEKQIAEIWEDLLEINNIKRSDNFFEIGGHSLIAIQFIIKIENILNIKIPMSTLFEYPTIIKMAEYIQSVDKSSKWKALVISKPTGTKIPLYLIHGGGLGILVFNNIIKYLDKEQPVFCLQGVGIDGVEEPLDSIEEMASLYISEILEQNPEGPYALGGYSSGGILAFEMAKQLKALGKIVSFLAVFDYDYHEITLQKSLRKKIKRKTIGLIPELFFYTRSLIRRPKDTFDHLLLIWKLRLVSFKRRLGFENKTELEGIYLQIQKAKNKFEIALNKYTMMPYDGELDLFVSADKVYYQDEPKYLGWKPFISKTIHVHKVKGNHIHIILPPNNIEFARILQNNLNLQAEKIKSRLHTKPISVVK